MGLKKIFRATEQLTERVQALRAKFASDVKSIPLERMVFLDESGSNLAMVTRRRWARVGQRAKSDRPANHGGNITMVGAIRATGPVVLKTMKGSMTGQRFVAWITENLAPRLKRGDVVFIDNLGAHHALDVIVF